jgi:hypothetical protein
MMEKLERGTMQPIKCIWKHKMETWKHCGKNFKKLKRLLAKYILAFVFLAIEGSLFKERIQEIKMIVSKRQKII